MKSILFQKQQLKLTNFHHTYYSAIIGQYCIYNLVQSVSLHLVFLPCGSAHSTLISHTFISYSTMAAVIRQLISKSLKPILNSRTLPTNSITNIVKPSFILPTTKLYSTVPTPYEIVDSKADNLADKG